MMKKFYFIILLLNIQLFAQPWDYDFGTGTGTFDTASTASETFLPTPLSGTARVYIGDAGGQFELVNPAVVGTGSELQGIAASGNSNGSINKFSIYEISNPSPEFSLKFTVRLDGGEENSEWILWMGDGSNPGFYNNDVMYYSPTIFCGIKWQFTATSAINTYVNLSTNTPTFWGSAIDSLGITKGANYVFEIFANNTGSAVTYTYGVSSEQVAAYSYDLWIDGEKVRDDDSRGVFTQGQDITSFCFMGRLSSGNAATIYIDDIKYSNIVEDGPFPVELTSFTSSIIGNIVKLNWETATEINNYGFDIERKVGNAESTVGQFEKIGFVNGNGNSNSPKYYSFTDKNVTSGIYSYRLKQIDNDGKYEYFKAIEVDLGKPGEYTLLQNYPNPFNPNTIIKFELPKKQMVSLRVYNVLGEMVKNLINEEREAGTYSVTFDGAGLPSGTYIYTLTTDNSILSEKMILLK